MGLYDGALGARRLRLDRPRRHADPRRPVVLVVDISARRRARSAPSCTAWPPSTRRRRRRRDPQPGRLAPARRRGPAGRRSTAARCSACSAATTRSPHPRATSAWSRPPNATRPPHAVDRLRRRGRRARRPRRGARRRPRGAPTSTGRAWDPARARSTRRRRPGRPVVAMAGGRGVHVPLRRDRGAARARPAATWSTFDPLADTGAARRARAGIYLGGGFPEVHAAELSGNAPLRAELRGRGRGRRADRRRVRRPALPLPTRVDGAPMVGALAAAAAMTARLTLRYPDGDGADRHRCSPAPASRSPATSSTAPTSSPARRRDAGLDGRRRAGRLRRRRPCTRRTSTRTGPATRSSPSGSPTRSTLAHRR